MRPWLAIIGVFVFGACSGNNAKTVDASVDANVPAMITISGTGTERGIGTANPVAGVAVAVYKSSDETNAVATTTTDAQGNYTLTITTNGAALDGFVKATKSGYVDTYLYAPAPLVANFSMASINMLTPSTYGAIFSFTQVSQTPGTGVIALEVTDTTMATVGGAAVTTSPAATYKYNGTGSPVFPSPSATSTQPDGIAYVLNVTAGQVTLSATKAGVTFKSHTVNVRAGAFTTTVITE